MLAVSFDKALPRVYTYLWILGSLLSLSWQLGLQQLSLAVHNIEQMLPANTMPNSLGSAACVLADLWA